jgi:hypothetical protein
MMIAVDVNRYDKPSGSAAGTRGTRISSGTLPVLVGRPDRLSYLNERGRNESTC